MILNPLVQRDRARQHIAGLDVPPLSAAMSPIDTRQVENFPYGGRDGWVSRFGRVGDLGQIEDRARVVDAYAEHVKQGLPVRFVRIFSTKPNYLLVKPKEAWGNVYSLDTRLQDPQVIHGALIDPRHISSTLVRHLGLVDPGTSEREVRDLCSQPAVIDGVRCAFLSLRRLSPRDNRLYIVQPTSDDLRGLYPDAREVAERARGGLLYLNEQPRRRGEEFTDCVEAAYFSSLRSAVRKTRHQETQQSAEYESVRSFLLVVTEFIPRMNASWKKGTDEEVKIGLVAELQSLVRRGFEIVGEARDSDKRDVRDSLQEALRLVSGREKRNPGAALTKLVRSLNRLSHRLETLGGTQSGADTDRIDLMREQLRAETWLNGFANQLWALRGRPERSAGRNLYPVEDDSLGLRVRPFSHYANAMRLGAARIRNAESDNVYRRSVNNLWSVVCAYLLQGAEDGLRYRLSSPIPQTAENYWREISSRMWVVRYRHLFCGDGMFPPLAYYRTLERMHALADYLNQEVTKPRPQRRPLDQLKSDLRELLGDANEAPFEQVPIGSHYRFSY